MLWQINFTPTITQKQVEIIPTSDRPDLLVFSKIVLGNFKSIISLDPPPPNYEARWSLTSLLLT
jgi:hypothetical protein